jgi:hypothetical protein
MVGSACTLPSRSACDCYAIVRKASMGRRPARWGLLLQRHPARPDPRGRNGSYCRIAERCELPDDTGAVRIAAEVLRHGTWLALAAVAPLGRNSPRP